MSDPRPRDLLFTLFGEFLLERAQPIWVGSLLELLEPFGLSEGAVRTALSRMSKRGWLSARRSGRRSFYRLTPRARTLLEEGQERIYRPPPATTWDGTWLLLAYSIPEGDRRLRDRLRDRLAWLGFGSMGNGMWISPHDVARDALRAASELGVESHIECFRAQRLSTAPIAQLVKDCWDLPSIDARYAAFARRWRARLETLRAREAAGTLTDDEAFAARFELVHEYRVFPSIDPALPSPLLPDSWSGQEAVDVFEELRTLLASPADRHVSSIVEHGPTA